MQYAGQLDGKIQPMTELEKARPDLLFTEQDRQLYYALIRSVPSVGRPDVPAHEIKVPSIETYVRWHEQATIGESYQAAHLLREYLQKYRDMGDAS